MKKLILFLFLLAPVLGFSQIYVTDSGNDFRIVRGTTYDNYFQKGNYEIAFTNDNIWIRNAYNNIAILSSRNFSEWVVEGASYGTRDSTIDAIAQVIYANGVSLSGDTLIVGTDTVLLAGGSSLWESGLYGSITPKLDAPMTFDSTGATGTSIIYQADSALMAFVNGLLIIDTLQADSTNVILSIGAEGAKDYGDVTGFLMMKPSTSEFWIVGIENIDGLGDYEPRLGYMNFPTQTRIESTVSNSSFVSKATQGFAPTYNKLISVSGTVDDLVLSATDFETASVINVNKSGVTATVTDTINMDTMKVEVLPIGVLVEAEDVTGKYTQGAFTTDFIRLQVNDTAFTDPESDILMNNSQIEIVKTSSDHSTEGNIIFNDALVSSGTEGTSDFVFGSPQLDDDGDVAHDKRMLFDKSQSFFAAGQATSTQWDSGNRGTYSAVFGNNNKVTGGNSFASGQLSNVSGNSASSFGRSNNVSGDYAHSFGYENDASAQYAMCLGGIFSTASGTYSVVTGNVNTAASYAEFVMGRYATNYTPSSATSWNDADRIFNIGNGTSVGVRHDVFTILKGGQVGIGNVDNFETASTGEMLQVNGATKSTSLQLTGLSEVAGNRGDTLLILSNDTVRYKVDVPQGGELWVYRDSTITLSATTQPQAIQGMKTGKVGGDFSVNDSTITYTGGNTIDAEVHFNISFESSANNQTFYVDVYKNDVLYKKCGISRTIGTSGANAEGSAGSNAQITLNTNDYIELKGSLGSGTSTITFNNINFQLHGM